MKLPNVTAAVRRSWQAHSPSELWLGAGMPGPSRPDPDDDPLATAVKYLSEKFGVDATKFDLAEIMARAINAAAGVPAAEDLGASVYIDPARREAVNPLFRPQMVEEFRRAIGEAASAVMSENYSPAREPPPLEQGSQAPSPPQNPLGRPQTPLGRPQTPPGRGHPQTPPTFWGRLWANPRSRRLPAVRHSWTPTPPLGRKLASRRRPS